MSERLFRFKQFNIKHERSAMKVGVDAVILGAWANLNSFDTVIDAGCGCGIIALMLAQRYKDLKIIGIDIDSDSCDEAIENVNNSPWKNRIEIIKANFNQICFNKSINVDHIVSNPPFYNSGIDGSLSSRMKARHIGDFGPDSLIKNGCKILTDTGKISLICPYDYYDTIEKAAKASGMYFSRLTSIRGNYHTKIKRILIELSKKENKCISSEITIEKDRGVATEEYINLTKDFYIKY